jgi:hypothetical protein
MSADLPAASIEGGADDVDTKSVVAAQIQALGDVAEIGEDLGLGGEPFAPRSALLQLFVE